MRILWCAVSILVSVSGVRSQVQALGQELQDKAGGKGNIQFIALVRDGETKNLIEDYTLSLDKAGGDGRTYKEELRCSDMSIVRFQLDEGLWRVRVSAEGYDEEVLEGIKMPNGPQPFQATYAWDKVQSFDGITIALPIFLKRMKNGERKSAVYSFLDDTIFYDQTDRPPEPIGGIKAIRDRVKATTLASKRVEQVRGEMSVMVYVDKIGDVIRTEVTQHLAPNFDELVGEVIRGTKFKPAEIMGMKVASRIEVRFRLDLESDRGTKHRP